MADCFQPSIRCRRSGRTRLQDSPRARRDTGLVINASAGPAFTRQRHAPRNRGGYPSRVRRLERRGGGSPPFAALPSVLLRAGKVGPRTARQAARPSGSALRSNQRFGVTRRPAHSPRCPCFVPIKPGLRRGKDRGSCAGFRGGAEDPLRRRRGGFFLKTLRTAGR